MARVDYKPLCNAISKNDVAAIRREIANQPEAVTHWKPITDAAFVGNAEVIKLLVDYGADCNVVSGTGSKHTPLTRLCQYHKTIPKHAGHVKALKQLLACGADPSISAGPLGLRPYVYAAVGPLEDLMECFDRSTRKADLFRLAVDCDTEELRHTQPGSKLLALDSNGRTLLHYVALSGVHKVDSQKPVECAEFLLSAGVEVDAIEEIPEAEDIFTATALWYAISWQQNHQLAELFLKSGANADIPVFAALWSGDLFLCKLLDSYGANWDQLHEGTTPLMEMIRYKRTQLIPWLLERGIDVSVKDREGKTALDLAIQRKLRAELVESIRQAAN